MRIATWNVNSINARLPTVIEVLGAADADVWCLQELKCIDEKFPRAEIEAIGFNCAVFGQKTYNGVAILSKFPISQEVRHLPGEPGDEQSRYLEVLVEAPRPMRVASIYLPNGNPRPGEKYDYKLRWMDRLLERARLLLQEEESVVLAGDYNCIPRNQDCWEPRVWADDALAFPPTRERFRALEWLGYSDAFMARDARSGQYSFWDYQAGAWQKDHGIRIDHLMCSPQAADRLVSVKIFRDARGLEKPSDHVPVIGTFLD
ncbi:MAG: exodeoxyribonuclease III [Alphaproteobacteria bacterium]|nr:exodeoxyribonuclease III [Alphaproteobacteria bacterium]